MIKFKFAVLCALLVFVGINVFAQDVPMESHKGKEHRTRKAGGTQLSGTGAGKIVKRRHNLAAGTHKGTEKRSARLMSRHPGGAN